MSQSFKVTLKAINSEKGLERTITYQGDLDHYMKPGDAIRAANFKFKMDNTTGWEIIAASEEKVG